MASAGRLFSLCLYLLSCGLGRVGGAGVGSRSVYCWTGEPSYLVALGCSPFTKLGCWRGESRLVLVAALRFVARVNTKSYFAAGCAVRFDSPKQIRLDVPDQYGCAGFTSYGYIKSSRGVTHIRNPDFDWAFAKRNPESIR